ncbi:MAG: hypothetical protein AMXMBFR81_20320 [Chthonomonas sp.]
MATTLDKGLSLRDTQPICDELLGILHEPMALEEAKAATYRKLAIKPTDSQWRTALLWLLYDHQVSISGEGEIRRLEDSRRLS